MHKVKDVVTKFFHPSFLFSPNNDTDRPKRKRSDSIEEVDKEQQIDRTLTNVCTKSHRSDNDADEPQLTDDEDNYSRDVPSSEQQTKRRRTANYQHISSTNSHYETDRTSPLTNSTDSRVSSTYTTPILRRTSTEQNYSEIINRSRSLYRHPSPYRKLTPNYDPSKSLLFTVGNRTTTANAQSNETAANHLLATSLIDRSSSSPVSTNKQSSGTLTNPISNRRQMFGANYSSIGSHRLPYIERLRRRTLQDCIRLDRVLDHERLSTATEESEPIKIITVSKPIRASEKECGIQCDIAIVESSQKSQATFPPKEVRSEVLSMPTTQNFQTNSSITIEKRQPPLTKTTNTITKPKVLGNITPFSWPKFARAQDEYGKKYPDKCRNVAVVPSLVGKSNINIPLPNQSQTNISNTTKLSSPLSRPAESIWKCPCCTKEHSAQTASCSLCHGINPDYKKPSANQPNVFVAKEPIPSPPTTANITAFAVTKESNIFTPVTPNFNPTVTKESGVTTFSPIVTTSSVIIPFPSFPIIPSASVAITTKENPVTTTSSSSISLFGITSITSQQSTITTAATLTTSSTIPAFSNTSSLPIPKPTASSIPTMTPNFMFGTKQFGSSTAAATVNPTTTTTQPSFGTVTTKENPLTTNRQFSFGTSSSSDNSMITSPINPFPATASFQPFAPISSTSMNPAVTTSNSIPSISFGVFGTSPSITTTATTTSAIAPISSMSIVSPIVTTASATVTVATTAANTSTIPISFGVPAVSSTSSMNNPIAFLNPSAPSFLPSVSKTIASASPAFGTSSFSLTSTSTLLPNNSPFGFNVTNALKPFVSPSIAPVSSNNAPTFGSPGPFGTSSMFNDRPANPFPTSSSPNPTPLFSFGVTSTNNQTSTVPAVGGFAFGAQSQAPPLFDATSQPTFPSHPMNFGIEPPTSSIPDPFMYSSPATDMSSIQDTGSALFNVGSGDPRSNSPRRILRARRPGRS